jgi:hypothetical protein
LEQQDFAHPDLQRHYRSVEFFELRIGIIPARYEADSPGVSQLAGVRIRSSPIPIRGEGSEAGRPLEITRIEHTAADLRAAATKSIDAAQVRRLLAIALVLDGDARTQAAEQTGMDRQTLRDWVHRYNDEGIDGLKSRSSPGRAPG